MVNVDKMNIKCQALRSNLYKNKSQFLVNMTAFFLLLFAINIYLVYVSTTAFEKLVLKKSPHGVQSQHLKQNLQIFMYPNRQLSLKLKLHHYQWNYDYPSYINVNFLHVKTGQKFQLKIIKDNNANIYQKNINFAPLPNGLWRVDYVLKSKTNKAYKSKYFFQTVEI